ncbi:hypothetical protein [Geothrix sp. 21YS21S-4]|uniref:helix-hairpin-helix domain-containing protein n=1 Tax=Geothrix sp. 21YS21S-4 TaxID=3068889 RepID=UPI0035931395
MKVLGPDVNESDAGYAPDGDHVLRVGLSFIKGLPKADLERLLAPEWRAAPTRTPSTTRGGGPLEAVHFLLPFDPSSSYFRCS